MNKQRAPLELVVLNGAPVPLRPVPSVRCNGSHWGRSGKRYHQHLSQFYLTVSASLRKQFTGPVLTYRSA